MAGSSPHSMRTVSVTSWVEEWDPLSQRWVRISETETRDSPFPARVPNDVAQADSPIAARFAVPFAPPAVYPAAPEASAVAQYGPFVVLDDSRAAIVGSTDSASTRAFDAMLRDFPRLAVLEFIDAPGTSNDIANLAVGRRIRAAGLTTHVPRGGSVRSGAVDVLVIDSVAALTPRAELEGEMGDSLPGLQARLMSQALRKLTGSISKSNCLVVFINQIRMKIGVMFGSPETTTGGNALKFYSSVRLDIRRIGALKDRDEVIGNQTRVKVVKNKVAPPFREVEFDILYGEGISKTGELLDLGVKGNIIEKSGSWYSYDSQRIGQGRENARKFLLEHTEISAEIEAKVRKNAGLIAEEMLGGPEPDADEGPEEAAG